MAIPAIDDFFSVCMSVNQSLIGRAAIYIGKWGISNAVVRGK
jgi:hypothetical protein